jgi:FAD/FMN-containing dehydrogenase
MIDGAYLGDEPSASALLAPLRALGPELDTFAMVPPAALGDIDLEPPEPLPFLSEHALLEAFPADVADALLTVIEEDSNGALALLALRHLGGALARPAPDGGALGSLDAWIAMIGAGVVADPGAAGAVGARAARLVDAMRPWAAGLGFSNFAENDPADTSSFLEPEVNRRLQRIKAKVDPGNLFRANHPLPPAANSHRGR